MSFLLTRQSRHTPADENSTSHGKFVPIGVKYEEVAAPILICIWFSAVFVLKFLFVKLKEHIKSHGTGIWRFLQIIRGMPDSCLLIIIGFVLGLMLPADAVEDSLIHALLDPEIFFIYILPPIVFEAGYEMPRSAFLSNLTEILTFAIIGTTLNAACVGTSLYFWHEIIGFSGLPGSPEAYTILVFLLFSSIVSAVDPVAVIAVFDDINVNVTLYIMVFGESLLNDGVAVVLYQVFEQFISMEYPDCITGEYGVYNICMALLSFVIIAGGGTLIGFVMGYLTAFFSRFSHALPSLEPGVMLAIPYLSYLIAEMFEMSAILSVVFCGFTMRYYVDKNLDEETLVTIERMTKVLAQVMEMTIFMVLGIYAGLADWKAHFDWVFSLTTLLFCSVWRPVFTIILTQILNSKRARKITWKDTFIMAFSGLRGGIAFSLIALSTVDLVISSEAKETLTQAVVFIVFFTSFIQGCLCGPIVKLFDIERISGSDPNKTATATHEKIVTTLTDGINIICGSAGVSHGFMARRFDAFVHKYLNHIFLKEEVHNDELDMLEDVVEVWQKEVMADHSAVTQGNVRFQSADQSNQGEMPKQRAGRRASVTKEVMMAQIQGSLLLKDKLSEATARRASAYKLGQSGLRREAKHQRQNIAKRKELEKKIREEQAKHMRKKRGSIFNRMTSSKKKDNDDMDENKEKRRKSFFQNVKKRVSIVAFSNKGMKYSSDDEDSDSDEGRQGVTVNDVDIESQDSEEAREAGENPSGLTNEEIRRIAENFAKGVTESMRH